MNKNIWIFLGVLVAVSLAGMFFLRKPATSPDTSSSPSATQTTQEEAVVEEDGEPIMQIKVSAKEFSFTPSTVSVKRGDKVSIVVTNDGKMPHDFVIDELNIRTKMLSAGESETLSFTIPDDGSPLTFYCSVGNHRLLGMEGEFSIE